VYITADIYRMYWPGVLLLYTVCSCIVFPTLRGELKMNIYIAHLSELAIAFRQINNECIKTVELRL